MKAVLGGLWPRARFAALGLLGLCSLACGGGLQRDRQGGAEGGAGSEQTGGGASGSAATSAGAGAVGGAGVIDPDSESRRLRLLTRAEYTAALTDLLGTVDAPLELPTDVSVAGFISIGASEVAVNASGVALYETASLAATEEVFSDAARWQKLVGCQPKADLSDGCVVTFIQSFGKRAYRRDLDPAEVELWARVGRDAAQLSGSAAQGLAAVTSGLLQSLNFLYRVEDTQLDATSGRLKYDGKSMATRLSFLLTGRPPSDALLAAAASGQLDTADGVRAAAAPLLDDPNAVARMARFFSEHSQADLALVVEKDATAFPNFDAPLQRAMVESTDLFFKNVVLAPGADVRSYFDSDQTFINTELAPIYGAPPPASGFVPITLAPAAGRAGILGQAAVIAGHSAPERTSPTRRGLFILRNLLCQEPPEPPPGVSLTAPPDDLNLTSRQKLEAFVSSEPCKSCHEQFDPLGFALEHFDAIGQYRVTEGDLPIDATGSLDGVSFDGEAELAVALRNNPRTIACLVSNFYRDANARWDAEPDAALIDSLGQSLASKKYVWRDLVADFVVSEAFRSAPAVLVEGGNQ